MQFLSRLQSLKTRYLLIAAFLVLILLIGALASSWYVFEINRHNADALAARDRLTERASQIRSDIWLADSALHALLITPKPRYEGEVTAALRRAIAHLDTLVEQPLGSTDELKTSITRLRAQLEEFRRKTRYLIEKRHDTSWVYPILPYISSKLLRPNNDFETAADLALGEIARDDGGPYRSDLYGRFDTVRDLWRRKILNFRAVVIRFAGLRDIETTPQEINIGQLHEIIEEKLDELAAIGEAGGLGLEAEEALATMRAASRAWQENWETVKKLRSADIWRADIRYLETELHPLQQEIFATLTTIDQAIVSWSEENTATVQQAARQIIYVLWGLAALGLAFIILVYALINRSVLAPIARIADILSQGEQSVGIRMEGRSSLEIGTLVRAFNAMQRQIHQRQLALEHQALHDALTSLPNRVLFNDRLEQAIHIMRRNGQKMSVLLLDLDRFKEINDTLGHQVGDQLLQQVGQRLETLLRESDTIARLGGDEFAIVAPGTDAEQARDFAEKIAAAINQPFPVENHNLYVGASIGVATFPEHGDDPVTLVRHADIAMYIAKQGGLDTFVYEPRKDTHSTEEISLVGDLHAELEKPTHITLHYQPLVDLLSREVTAVEALLRWEHPRLGFVSPEKIIKIAEHTGLIGPLTAWVIDTAIGDCAECRFGEHAPGIAINLSAWNLQDPELPAVIAECLARHEFSAQRLTLEITESAMMSDPVRAREVLVELNDMGVVLAVDDYGTGFSSLGYLKMLPVSCLKIDKSFVLEMLRDDNDAVIVRSTIELAHNLGLKVVAEGVEDQETLLQLRQHRCDIAQGFFISRPLPRDELLTWYESYRPRAVR